ncbi:MAG: hypothetical protein ABSC30_10075 [Acidimicrobiales bacterium]
MGEQLAFGRRVLVAGGHLGVDRLAQSFGPIGWHLDAAVEVLDLGLQLVGGDVAFLAARAIAAVLLPQAVEVGVDALGALDRESPPAHAADEHALEVVVVAALPGAAHGPGGQQLLDLVERVPLDEGLVTAGVLDAVPLDDADVGAVGEQAGEARDGECLGAVVAVAAPVAKAPVRDLLGQALDRPLARGVQLEGGFDERGAFGVRDDVRDLAAADGLADVEVAEGSLVGVAAHLGLLAHPLSDLARQVGGVELGHQGVDALDQSARGGLVEVLGHRDKRHAATTQ